MRPMDNNRKEKRYSTYLMNPGRAFIEIDAGRIIRGRITDLSAGGLSFETGCSREELSLMEDMKEYSMVIVIGTTRIVSGVKKVWAFVEKSEEGTVFVSGVKFEKMSNPERLNLYSIIEKVRAMSPHTS